MAKLGRPRIAFAPEDATLSWREEAKCHEAVRTMPSLLGAWTTERTPDTALAREVCSDCSVRYQCVMAALADPEAEGIRAGYAFEGGALESRDRAALAEEFGLESRLRRPTRAYR
jgi:hypothetical protein